MSMQIEPIDPHDERLALYRLASRLTIAFWAWALVVGIVGTLALLYAQSIRDDARYEVDRNRAEHIEMEKQVSEIWLYSTTTRERQTNMMERLVELEREQRSQSRRK